MTERAPQGCLLSLLFLPTLAPGALSLMILSVLSMWKTFASLEALSLLSDKSMQSWGSASEHVKWYDPESQEEVGVTNSSHEKHVVVSGWRDRVYGYNCWLSVLALRLPSFLIETSRMVGRHEAPSSVTGQWSVSADDLLLVLVQV